MRMGDSLQTRGLGRVSGMCEGDNVLCLWLSWIASLSLAFAAPLSVSLFFSVFFSPPIRSINI